MRFVSPTPIHNHRKYAASAKEKYVISFRFMHFAIGGIPMHFAIIQDVFINNLLPVLLCAATGFVLGRTLRPDVKTASRLAFYIFSPCLVFVSLVHVEIPGDEFAKLALFTLAVTITMGALAFLFGKLVGAGRQIVVSLIVSSMFVNSGNYGLAATKFSFGEAALARAMVCFVFGTVTVYTLGILVSSMGKLPVRQALRSLLLVPAFYALIAAAIVRNTAAKIPLFLDRSVSMLGEASIPLMLVILGLQVAEARVWPREKAVLIGGAAFLQLVLTPLIALGMAHWMGLTGIARQSAVLQASMPAAVATTVLAVQYDLDQTLVSGTVVLTTLLSPLTLTPLIAYLLMLQ
jgi:malate permease and related proteins